MKLIPRLTLFLMMFVFVAGCNQQTAETPSPPSPPPTPSVSNTTSDDAPKNASSASEIIIDVRSKAEWDSGHLEQAILIPHTEIGEKIAGVTEDKSAKIVLYCKVGGRAGLAKETLETLGYTNVENAGGFDDIKKRYGGE